MVNLYPKKCELGITFGNTKNKKQQNKTFISIFINHFLLL